MTVYWSYLAMPSIPELAASSLVNVALWAGNAGYQRIVTPYMRTDVARNRIVSTFREITTSDDDALIMLDADHTHPQDVLDRLLAHKEGVVGALAVWRNPPYTPCFMFRAADGRLHAGATWDEDAVLIPCTVVGTGAICIRRWVFDALEAKGIEAPFFRYHFEDGMTQFPSEDAYFGAMCEAAGISHHVDVTLEIPHLTNSVSDLASWTEWMNANQDMTSAVSDLGMQPAKTYKEAIESLKEPINPAMILTRLEL
jgi:hypothetical protein